MRKIKVLRLIARLNIGGPSIHAILLTAGLQKDSFESLLACGSLSSAEGDMLYYAENKKIYPIFIKELQRDLGFWNDCKAFIKIFALIRKEKPDILHTHTAKAGTLGRIAAFFYAHSNPFKIKKIIVLHTFHGHVFYGYFSRFKSGFFIAIERILATVTSRTITVSESLKKELLAYKICPESKISVVPLGFELEQFLAVPKKTLSGFTVGIIGRLVPIKNHDFFLKAASIFLKNHETENIRIKIVGDGELKNKLIDLSKVLGISDKVDFLGWQTNLPEVYAGLDAVALTSLNEGTPVSLIEAMACALPVIASDVGGVSDILGIEENQDHAPNISIREHGILFKSQDISAFIAGLEILFAEKALCVEMGKKCRDFAAKRFTKERLVKDIEQLYLTLLSK